MPTQGNKIKKTKTNQAEMKAMQTKMDTALKEIKAGQDAWIEEMKADR
jgi:hypothetical protein